MHNSKQKKKVHFLETRELYERETVVRRWARNRDRETGEVEELALQISSALGRHPGSSALQLFTSVLTQPTWREGGRVGERRGEEATKDVFHSGSLQPSNSASSR